VLDSVCADWLNVNETAGPPKALAITLWYPHHRNAAGEVVGGDHAVHHIVDRIGVGRCGRYPEQQK
jgi:hypothetical protein